LSRCHPLPISLPAAGPSFCRRDGDRTPPGIADDENEGNPDEPCPGAKDDHGCPPAKVVYQPDDDGNQEAAGAKAGGQDPECQAYLRLEPVGDDMHQDNTGTTTSPEGDQDDARIEHPERLGETEHDKTDAYGDHAPQGKPPRTAAVDEKADHGGKQTHLDTPEAQGKGDLGIAPAKLLDEGIEKCGEAEEGDGPRNDTDDEAGEEDPPSVKDIVRSRGKPGSQCTVHMQRSQSERRIAVKAKVEIIFYVIFPDIFF